MHAAGAALGLTASLAAATSCGATPEPLPPSSYAFGEGPGPAETHDRGALAPTTLAERAPGDTRIFLRLDAPGVRWLASLPPLEGWVKRARACGVDPESDVRTIELAIAPPFEVVAEVTGGIRAGHVACMTGHPYDAGVARVGSLVFADEAGALFVHSVGSIHDGPGVDPTWRERLATSPGSHLLAAVGPTDGVLSVHLAAGHLSATAAPQSQLMRALAGVLGDLEPDDAAEEPAGEDAPPVEIAPTAMISSGSIVVDIASHRDAIAALFEQRIAFVEAETLAMEPTLLPGDLLLVFRGATDVGLGDIVSVGSPRGHKRILRRVVGAPGDEIELEGQHLRVNGYEARRTLLEAEYVPPNFQAQGSQVRPPRSRYREMLGDASYSILLASLPFEAGKSSLRLGDEEYYVLGDDRDNAYDSRAFGPVESERIAGRASVILWSVDDGGDLRWGRLGRAPDAVAAANASSDVEVIRLE